jgi:hypothetical protein
MSSRFLTGVLSALLGGFVIVVSQAFRPPVPGWVAVAFAIAVLVAIGIAQLDHTRGAVQRVLDGFSAVEAGLFLAFALAASGTAVTWLSFAFALGSVGVTIANPTLNEIANWRSWRQLAELRWMHQVPTAVISQSQAA